MKYKTVPDKIDEESLVRRIHSLLDEIQTEAEPQLLNQYRSVFRKEVSFFRRSYLAAYLLLLAEQGKTFKRRRDSRWAEDNRENFRGEVSGKGGARREDFRSQEEAHFLPEEDAARLFVSIGRNRKVFPREIIGLLNTKARITRDDIGGIRILDNYSFVQVRNAVADAVIKALNGQNFRGRTLTVNYARIKKDDPEAMEYGDSGGPEFSENG
ncbi:MAG: DbpA RNA binding domain-containing protein [Treponema sp.]|jgi:hypothetical protein|nr:DbpA RNA binding domain-containing protein [Treponema sp.]